MNIHTGMIQLHSALKDARRRWEETLPLWTDSVRMQFEEHHWEPLVTQVLATHRAMEHVSHLLGRMQQECS
jgi:hypothetical protein